MRIRIMLLFFAVSSIVFAGSKSLSYKNNVVIDGKMLEWTLPLPNFDKTTGINYDIANDDQNLYMILRVVDSSTQRQILSNGFDLWINPDGKKKKIMGVSYPLPMLAPEMKNVNQLPKMVPEMKNADPSPKMAPEMNIDNPLQNEIVLKGFPGKNGIQLVSECPVRTAINFDKSGCMVYELSVPFNLIQSEQHNPENKDRIFCIGFFVKKSDSSSRPSGSGNNGMRGGNPMGGRGGGPMGGGDSMDEGGSSAKQISMNDASSMNTEKKYWFKVTPAVR